MGVTNRVLTTIMDQIATSSSTTLCLVACVLLIAIYTLHHIRQLRAMPVGPWGLPILGSLLNIRKPFHLAMADLARQYGPLVSLSMGRQLVVMVNDVALLRRCFASADLTARPRSVLDSLIEGYGLITADGALWANQRRFLHSHKFGLKNWGANISEQLESRVSHEVLDCLNHLAKDCCATPSNNNNNNIDKNVKDEETASTPIDPAPYLACSVSNVICSIIMSTRFRPNTPRFSRFLHFFDEGFRLFTLTGPLIFLPFLRIFPSMTAVFEKLRANRNQLLDFISEVVDEHRRVLDVKQAPRDLVDQYLIEIEKCRREGTTESVFGDKDPDTQLKQVLVDLFSAGFETVKSTLLWSLVHVMRNPDVKQKVQAELSQVVGPGRLPCMEDMTRLAYTRAVIYESMRRSTAVPLGTTHSNTRPILIAGKLIPANSHVVPNIHAIHMDPNLWEQPEQFKPERFINADDGTLSRRPRHFLPFGSGRRMCLGDALAETELQLFFASIMHVFDVEPAVSPSNTSSSSSTTPMDSLPSLEGNLGATLTPDQFHVRFTPRNVEALIAANLKAKPFYSQHMRIYG